jgi:hypothetical protein
MARQIFSNFKGDVVLVELASLSDLNLVPSAVATNLGQQLAGDKITPALSRSRSAENDCSLCSVTVST